MKAMGLVACAAALLSLSARISLAQFEQPLHGTKVVIKHNFADPSKSKLVFLAKDALTIAPPNLFATCSGAPQGSCTRDFDCECHEACAQGTCVEPCRGDFDCAGRVCGSNYGRCSGSAALCNIDDDVPCAVGQCKKSGGPCHRDSDCQGDGGTCVGGEYCNPLRCWGDEYCPSGLLCPGEYETCECGAACDPFEDPVLHVTSVEGQDVTVSLPQGTCVDAPCWTASYAFEGSTCTTWEHADWLYRDRKLTNGPCKSVRIEGNHQLKIVCKGLPFSPPFAGRCSGSGAPCQGKLDCEPPAQPEAEDCVAFTGRCSGSDEQCQSSLDCPNPFTETCVFVNIMLAMGADSARYCARFGGKVQKNERKPSQLVFKASAAGTPVACDLPTPVPSSTPTPAATPTPGDCCVARPETGCSIPACESCVCALDPFCCTVAWDGVCASEAANQCAASCPC